MRSMTNRSPHPVQVRDYTFITLWPFLRIYLQYIQKHKCSKKDAQLPVELSHLGAIIDAEKDTKTSDMCQIP